MLKLKRALAALVLAATFMAGQAFAAQPYSLANYHLTLPVDAAGNLSGKAAQIEPNVLTKGYQSEWFTQDADGYTFICPDGGAVTDTAHYARSELRGKKEYAYNQRITETVRLKFLELPEGTKVVFEQFHDKKIPWVKMVAETKQGKINIRGLVKTGDGDKEVSIDLVKGLALRQEVNSRIDWFPADTAAGKSGYIRMTVNGEQKRQAATHTGKNGKVYGKKGAYVQTSARKGQRVVIRHY